MSDVYLSTRLDVGGRSTSIGGVLSGMGRVTSRSLAGLQTLNPCMILVFISSFLQAYHIPSEERDRQNKTSEFNSLCKIHNSGVHQVHI
jgi:hypothetical protein